MVWIVGGVILDKVIPEGRNRSRCRMKITLYIFAQIPGKL
jgi:hypothetical protein